MLTECPPNTGVPAIWRMSAFLEMCPKEIKEQMYLRSDEIGEDYDVLKAKVIGWISNKVEQERSGPVPMDVGDLRKKTNEEDEYEEQYWEEHNVDEISGNDYQCRKCGGYGHFARDCPSKGKGKGKNGDKGKGKGFYKGKGDGGDPKGYGKDGGSRRLDTTRRARATKAKERLPRNMLELREGRTQGQRDQRQGRVARGGGRRVRRRAGGSRGYVGSCERDDG